jgi:hypothetical protein
VPFQIDLILNMPSQNSLSHTCHPNAILNPYMPLLTSEPCEMTKLPMSSSSRFLLTSHPWLALTSSSPTLAQWPASSTLLPWMALAGELCPAAVDGNLRRGKAARAGELCPAPRTAATELHPTAVDGTCGRAPPRCRGWRAPPRQSSTCG